MNRDIALAASLMMIGAGLGIGVVNLANSTARLKRAREFNAAVKAGHIVFKHNTLKVETADALQTVVG